MSEIRAKRYSENEIDIRELWNLVWAEKWLIVTVTAVFALFSVIYALLQTNIYRAEAVLAPAAARQSASPLVSQLGGAAALVGINIGSQDGGRVGNTLAILRSREYIGRFIEEHELLVPLFASTWDGSTGRSIIDPDIYNETTGEWLLQNGQPRESVAYRRFLTLLNITQEPATGLLRISIEWQDPVQASLWVNQLVHDINRDIKAADVEEANNAIQYLRQQLATTQLVEMQRVFYQLIESQTRITMLADVRDDYVFQIIDHAVVPDQKIAPRRPLIVIIGSLLGSMLAVMFVLLRPVFRLSDN